MQTTRYPRTCPGAAATTCSSPFQRTIRAFGLTVALLAGCRSNVADLAAPSASTGNLALVIDSLPTGGVAAITVTNAQGYRRVLNGPGALNDLPLGSYTVSAADIVVGDQVYTAVPAIQTITIGPSATATPVAISFVRAVPRASGVLALTVTGLPTGLPAALSLVAPDGTSRSVTGSGVVPDLKPGSYNLVASDVVTSNSTYRAQPTSQLLTVPAGGTISGAVTYLASPNPGGSGTLAITITGLPAGAGGSVLVSGPGGYARWIGVTQTLAALPVGSYTVTATSVTIAGAEFVGSPLRQTTMVGPGSTTAITVAYAPPAPASPTPGSLTLAIGGLPAGTDGSVTVTGAGGFSRLLTGAATLTNLPVGKYTVTAGTVVANGATYTATPTTQVTAIAAAAVVTATVSYATVAPAPPSSGSLAVTIAGLPTGVAGMVSVTGPGGWSRAITATQSFAAVVPGNYTVAATNVTSGGITYAPQPLTQVVAVAGNATATATVTYAVTVPPPSVGALAIAVSGLPGGVAASVSVTGPDGMLQALTASQTLASLAPGSYTISAANVTAAGVTYLPQSTTQVVSVGAGAAAAASVVYAAAVAPATVLGALSVAIAGIPAGRAASVTVTGPGGFSELLTGSRTLSGLAPGTYLISAAGISAGGFAYAASPSSQTQAIAAGASASVSVRYAAANGSLIVAVSGLPASAGASVTVIGPGGFSQLVSSSQTLTGLAPGSYTVAATSVTASGAVYAPVPASQTQTVVAGATAAANVAYAAAPTNGTLAVTLAGLPAGITGSVSVTGPGGYFQWFTASQTFSGLLPGTYTIYTGNVTSGGTTYTAAPAVQTATVVGGTTVGATVTYSGAAAPAVGALAVTIAGLPAGGGGSVTVTGPAAFSQWFTTTRTLSSLAPGSYTITAGNVAIGGVTYAAAVASQVKSVAGASTTAATITYAAVTPPPATGGLTVVVTGLPAGVSGNVTVTGPGAFSQLVTSTQTLSGLAVGAYTIGAATVTSGGVVYAASPASQTATVVAGATVLATVTYSGTAPSGFGPLSPGFQARTMVVQGVTYGYQIFIPHGYTPLRTWPVVLAVHGSGERGSDNQAQLTVGLGPYVSANSSTFLAIVVFPQMPNPSPGALTDSIIIASLDRTLREVNADSTRLYITGLSLGAYRTWDLVYRFPTLFAAAMPIAGDMCPGCMGGLASYSAAYAAAAQRLKALPLHTYHGSADTQAPVQADRDIAAAFAAAGATAFLYTEYAGLDHAPTWTTAYADPNTWAWLFAQHR